MRQGHGRADYRFPSRREPAAFEADGSRTAQLVNLTPGSLELALSTPAPNAGTAHPRADGGDPR